VELLDLLLRIPRPAGVSHPQGAPHRPPRWGPQAPGAVRRWRAVSRAQRRMQKQAQEVEEGEGWPAVYLLPGGRGGPGPRHTGSVPNLRGTLSGPCTGGSYPHTLDTLGGVVSRNRAWERGRFPGEGVA